MAVDIKNVKRVIKYEGAHLSDPSPSMTPDGILTHYTGTFPELVNGRVEVTRGDNELILELFKDLGTKG